MLKDGLLFFFTYNLKNVVQTVIFSFSQLTEGYSGSDIRLVCKEAAMRPVRKIFDILEEHESSKY